MKNLNDYQKAFTKAANKKFDNKDWTQRDRLLSMQRQLSDIGAALQKEEGIYNHCSIHNSVNHSIAALIADTLLLAGHREKDGKGFDIEKELEKVLKFFKF